MPLRLEHVVAVGFVGFLATPLAVDVAVWDAGITLPGMREPVEVARVQPGEWLDGIATQKVEQGLLGGSVIARWVVPHYNARLLELLHRTPPAARLRPEGWVFMTDRTEPLPPRRYQELLEEVPGRVRAAVREVEAEGLEVVVVIVPDRARMSPERAYPSGRLPAAKEAYLPRLVAKLREAGLRVIELEPSLRRLAAEGGEPFYRADHHWTSRGAQAGAEALAVELRRLGLVPRCEPEGRAPFEIEWHDELEVTSLVPKLGFPDGGELERSWQRTYERAATRRSGDGDPRQAPIVYVTSSYGRWGAPEMLANALGCPVVTALRNGNSFTSAQSLRDRARRHADLAHARLLVWELLEYDLYSAEGVALGRDG